MNFGNKVDWYQASQNKHLTWEFLNKDDKLPTRKEFAIAGAKCVAITSTITLILVAIDFKL